MPFFKPTKFADQPFRSERSVRAAGAGPLAAGAQALVSGALKMQSGQHQREDIDRANAAKAAALGNGVEPRVSGELDVSPAPFEGAEGLTGLELQQGLGIQPLPEVMLLAQRAQKIRMRIAAGGSRAEGEDALAVEFRKTLRQIGPENIELQQSNLREAMSTVIGGRADRQIATGKGIDPSGESVAIKSEQARGQALGINPKMMEGMDLQTLRDVVGFRQRAELDKTDHIDGINRELKERELQGKRKADTLTKTSDILRRNTVSRLEPIKKQLDTFLARLPPGTIPTGDVLLQFEQILARATFDLARGVTNDLDQPGANGGASMGSVMNEEERKEASAYALTALDAYRELLTNPQTGMQGVAARFNDGTLTADVAEQNQTSEGWRKAKLIKEGFGDGAIAAGLITAAVKGFEDGVSLEARVVQGMNKTGETKGAVGAAVASQQTIALTTGSTQKERVAVVDKAGGGDPVINRGTAIAPLAALYEPTASLELKRKGYMSVYGPGNFDAAMQIAGTGTSASAGKQLTYLNGTVTASHLAQVKKYGSQAGFDAVGGVTRYYVENLDNVSRQAVDTLTIAGLNITYHRETETFVVPVQDRPAPKHVDLFGGGNVGSDLLDNVGLAVRKFGDVVNTEERNESAEVLTESVASLRAFGRAVGATPEESDQSVGRWLWSNDLIDKLTAESYGLKFAQQKIPEFETTVTRAEGGESSQAKDKPKDTLTAKDKGAEDNSLTKEQARKLKTADFRELLRSGELTPNEMKIILKEVKARKKEQDELDVELDAAGRPKPNK